MSLSDKEDWSVDIQGPDINNVDDSVIFILDHKDGYRIICEVDQEGEARIKLFNTKEFYVLQKENLPIAIQYISEKE